MKRLCLLLLMIVSCGAPLRVASTRPVLLAGGAVACGEPHATQVGIEILQRGGNAVDAAIAVAFALAVTLPEAGNLGGGGFMLISTPEITVIDYRETAPAAASRDMFLDAKGAVVPNLSLSSHRASGVPGTVAGLWEAHRQHGSMKWADLVAPAIRLAADGWTLDATTQKDLHAILAGPHHPSFAKYFTGDPLVQKDLAATLTRIAEKGRDGFYLGETARLIVEEMQRGGGLISQDDLSKYAIKLRTPVTGTFMGRTIVSMPPPSSGGAILIHLLNMVERLPAAKHNSPQYIHQLAEAMKRAFADRAEYFGDPDFVKVPIERLISKEYAVRRLAEFTEKRTDPAKIRAGDRDHTTHFSVVDRWGNAVSNTYTLNDSYGSGIVVDGAGFLLNNEMDDFSSKPGAPNMFGVTGDSANAIVPGKRMLSSMTPTFVFDAEGRLELVIGSPGGPRIITTVLQVILNRYAFEMPLNTAVQASRFHHQWPPPSLDTDPIRVERGALPAETLEGLKAMGYAIKESGPMGLVNAIEINWSKKRVIATSDPRGIGTADSE